MTFKLYSLENKFIEEVNDYPENFTGIVISDYNKAWYLNGELHRLDGPAREYHDGSRFWFVDGKRHRLDGPAYVGYDGTKVWFVNDKSVTELEHKLLCDIMRLKGLI